MGTISHEDIKQSLFNISMSSLDPVAPSVTLLEQYKVYIQYIDKVSERRQNANSFFLSLNTGVCGLLGYVAQSGSATQLKAMYWLLPLAGILLSGFWDRLVTSYRHLTAGKFTVLYLMEERLPVAPFTAEWTALGEGKDKHLYTPLTSIEVWIPRLFIALYLGLLVYLLA